MTRNCATSLCPRGFAFTRHVPVLKIPGSAGFYSSYAHGNLLFDLEQDQYQEYPLYAPALEAAFIRKLSLALSAAEVPSDEWLRLGIPTNLEQITEAWVVEEHQQRTACMEQILGPLHTLKMHPDTRTLLLEIAACSGGKAFIHALIQQCSGNALTRQDVVQCYENGYFDSTLAALFNKPY